VASDSGPKPLTELLAELRTLQVDLDRHELPASVTATLDHAIENLRKIVASRQLSS